MNARIRKRLEGNHLYSSKVLVELNPHRMEGFDQLRHMELCEHLACLVETIQSVTDMLDRLRLIMVDVEKTTVYRSPKP